MPQTIQRSFTSGEIAPSLQSRADLTKYTTGLNLCENFLVRAQGGVYSRPGFSFRGEQDDHTKKGRLIPFSFNTEQTYMLVFEDLKMRVMKDGGYVLKQAVITGVTKANPAVVTAVNTFSNGDQVIIENVEGMTELNGNTYTVANVTGINFELQGIDSTSYGIYTSGGTAQGDTIFELVTPYTEAQLPRLNYTQSADVMTIAHPDHDPSNINRLADGYWTLTTINYASTGVVPTFLASLAATIVSISNDNPALVVTAAPHGFSDGQTVEITGVVGMTELNGRLFTVFVLTTIAFELVAEDSTLYTPYVSGGVATRPGAIQNVGTGFGTNNKFYAYVVTSVDANGVESLPSTEVNITSLSLTQTGGIRIAWDVVPGAAYYRIYKDPSNNSRLYGWIGDSTTATFDDFNIAPITSDAPPSERTPFDGVNNKPAAVNYYQQRQVFANTNNEPQATYTTQVNNFNSLRTSNPARDDDAVTFTIAAQQVNEIRHIVSLDSLILLTSGGEWIVSEGQDRVLTPSTIGVRIQSYNGSSWVKPVIINSTALYLQEKGARIRDLGYEFSSDKYTGNDLSLMSEHLFEGHQIVEMAYADEPYGILWCVRDDGVLLGLTYLREHKVWGWHQHNTDGEFESIATISEEGRDAVYVIVKRTINGQIKRYVERLEARESTVAEDAFFVDSGLSYNGLTAVITGATQANPVVITTITSHGFTNGESVNIKDVVGMTELNNNTYTVANVTANTFELSGVDGTGFTAYSSGGLASIAVTTLSGLDHLEGKEVAILTDGYVTNNQTVTSGSITLTRAASKVHVGLPYTPAIELLDIDAASTTDTIKAKSVSVSKVFIEVEDTAGGFVGARQDPTSDQPITFREIKPRFDSDGYGTGLLRTYKQEVIIDPLWSKSGGVRIEQRSPLPMAILSVIPTVDIGGS